MEYEYTELPDGGYGFVELPSRRIVTDPIQVLQLRLELRQQLDAKHGAGFCDDFARKSKAAYERRMAEAAEVINKF